MKLSRFNHFLRVDGHDILAYNTRTTALARLEASEYAQIPALCDGREADTRGQASALREAMAGAGFLVPDNADELDELGTEHAVLKGQAKALGLTIVPTLDCNFRCVYCFSYARRNHMSQQVQDALVGFIEKRLPGSQGLSVSWFGGEPTLCLGLIERLSARLRTLCDRLGVPFYPASIVTNGYLLNARSARQLTEAGVVDAQVTLDGDQASHDARRPLRGGQGTFDRIIANLVEVRAILNVKVRINIDRTNAYAAVAALDALAAAGLRGLPAYFGHVQPFTEACSGAASNCLSDPEFARLEIELNRQALARGFNSFSRPDLRLGGVCGAENDNCFLVAPDGTLFKCWAQASLGVEHSVGSVLDEDATEQQAANLAAFAGWDPVTDAACRECGILPLCMGGCPYLRLHGAPGANCSPLRYSLPDTIGLRYRLQQLIRAQGEHVAQHALVRLDSTGYQLSEDGR
jgi:uncharacterized protein